ncbi:MAG TPA: cytochrome c biogenesis protein CcdA [Thermomicrobiales bacterium]|nr:cytochrome c biogenesis protein CcdA [Thermomicrobiales bacterium]
MFAAFGAGVVSFLSPCVAPLLPGYLSMISGSVAGASTTSRDRLRLFWSSLVFVLGFSLVFVTLGASVSVFGDLLASQRRTMMQVSGAVMILMGAVILWGARFPFMMRERRLRLTPRHFSLSEILLLGMAFGFGWTPCFGPILASILVYTSTVDTVRHGTLLLTAYSIGLGIPFLLVGLGLGQFQQFARSVGRHARAIVTFSGVSLIAVGLLFVSGQMFRLAIAGQKLLASLPEPFSG